MQRPSLRILSPIGAREGDHIKPHSPSLPVALRCDPWAAHRPGERGTGDAALVMVRASHTPYLAAYPDQMHDVRMVDIRPMLR